MSGDSNTAMWNAYPDSEVDLWDQNLVNREFVIAYEINPGLDHKLQNMLPKVVFFIKRWDVRIAKLRRGRSLTSMLVTDVGVEKMTD